MPYLTGGLAYQRTTVLWDYENGGDGDPDRTFRLSPWGWTVGVGLEVAHSPKVSWKVEYLYAAFPSRNTDAQFSDDTPPYRGVKFANNVQMVRFGVNFRFP